MSTGTSSLYSIDRVLYSLRLMLTSVYAEVELGLEARAHERVLCLSAVPRPAPKRKREVTTHDFQQMHALQGVVQGYLDMKFPGTSATALDVVLLYARLIRKCEFRETKRHVANLIC